MNRRIRAAAAALARGNRLYAMRGAGRIGPTQIDRLLARRSYYVDQRAARIARKG